MNKDLQLQVRLNLNGASFDRGMRSSVKNLGRLGQSVAGVRKDMQLLNREFNGFSQMTRLAGEAGILIMMKDMITESAELDKSLTRIKQTASMSVTEIAAARTELWRMSEATGVMMNELKEGLDSAVQSGLSFKEAMPVLDAVNKAVAVTNANANTLTKSMTVAATAFDFDLSKPQLAVMLLDKMVVAGRNGNAELENLSDIFARVGINAASANLTFTKTLALVEALSLVERQPERLGTLVDSTLRVFTNSNYMAHAQKATGIKFFDAKGARRDAIEVLKDIKKKYDTLKTDAKRFKFISDAFGKDDMDTIKGIKTLLSGESLSKIDEFAGKIETASGTIAHDLPEAMNNAVDQAGRLRAVMGEAGDNFARPINDVLTRIMKTFADKKEDGGLDPSAPAVVGGVLGTLGIGRLIYKRLFGVPVTEPTTAPTPKNLNQALGFSKVPPQAGRFSRFMPGMKSVFKYGAPLTAAFSAYDAYNVYSDKNLTADQKNAQYGRVGGGAVGSLGGAAIGAGVGALFGGVGAIPGALIGGSIGNMIGESAGEELVNKLQNADPQKVDVGGQVNFVIDDQRTRVTGVKSNNPNVTYNIDNGLYMPGTH
jgi:TP901 family phage tail tape measure protein